MAAVRLKTIETVQHLPEIDRLEGFPHPRENPILVGHKQAERMLLRALNMQKLPHAWLLSGPEGVGKATLAYRFARYIFSDPASRIALDESLEVAPETREFRQVAALSHPNLLVIRRAWNSKTKRFPTTIQVDEVRRLRAFLSTTSGKGSWRIIIVDRADELNANSANALLKSLEEPPKNCIFFLIASMPGRLPATIRSRCRRMELYALGREDLMKAVRRLLQTSELDTAVPQIHAPTAEDLELIYELSGGSVGRAVQFMDSEALGLYRTIIRLLEQWPALNKQEVNKISDQFAAAGASRQFELFFTLLSDVVHRSIRYKAGLPIALIEEQRISQKLFQAGTLDVWAELWETLSRRKAEVIALNLDRKNFVLETFYRIEKMAKV